MKATPELERFEQACRKGGLKLTHQRKEVYKAIFKAKDHPSVDEIYTVVQRRTPSISLDTVYRTVDTFEELGLVRRFQGSDGRFRFDTNTDTHQHLVCTRCHRIQDLHWSDIEELPLPRVVGWSGLSLAHVEIKGLCSDCRSSSRR